jgi:hypothetical protein
MARELESFAGELEAAIAPAGTGGAQLEVAPVTLARTAGDAADRLRALDVPALLAPLGDAATDVGKLRTRLAAVSRAANDLHLVTGAPNVADLAPHVAARQAALAAGIESLVAEVATSPAAMRLGDIEMVRLDDLSNLVATWRADATKAAPLLGPRHQLAELTNLLQHVSAQSTESTFGRANLAAAAAAVEEASPRAAALADDTRSKAAWKAVRDELAQVGELVELRQAAGRLPELSEGPLRAQYDAAATRIDEVIAARANALAKAPAVRELPEAWVVDAANVLNGTAAGDDWVRVDDLVGRLGERSSYPKVDSELYPRRAALPKFDKLRTAAEDLPKRPGMQVRRLSQLISEAAQVASNAAYAPATHVDGLSGAVRGVDVEARAGQLVEDLLARVTSITAEAEPKLGDDLINSVHEFRNEWHTLGGAAIDWYDDGGAIADSARNLADLADMAATHAPRHDEAVAISAAGRAAERAWKTTHAHTGPAVAASRAATGVEIAGAVRRLGYEYDMYDSVPWLHLRSGELAESLHDATLAASRAADGLDLEARKPLHKLARDARIFAEQVTDYDTDITSQQLYDRARKVAATLEEHARTPGAGAAPASTPESRADAIAAARKPLAPRPALSDYEKMPGALKTWTKALRAADTALEQARGQLPPSTVATVRADIDRVAVDISYARHFADDYSVPEAAFPRQANLGKVRGDIELIASMLDQPPVAATDATGAAVVPEVI